MLLRINCWEQYWVDSPGDSPPSLPLTLPIHFEAAASAIFDNSAKATQLIDWFVTLAFDQRPADPITDFGDACNAEAHLYECMPGDGPAQRIGCARSPVR
jgi:hypothetical protein